MEGDILETKVKVILKEELDEMIVHAVHGENVDILPKGAECLASSDRSQHEIWKLGDRVLCIQSHPEFNQHYIEQVIVQKMYAEDGKLDDMQRNEVLASLTDPELPIMRNLLNKFVFNFLYI